MLSNHLIEALPSFLVPSGFVKVGLLQEYMSYNLKRHPNLLYISCVQFLIQLMQFQVVPDMPCTIVISWLSQLPFPLCISSIVTLCGRWGRNDPAVFVLSGIVHTCCTSVICGCLWAGLLVFDFGRGGSPPPPLHSHPALYAVSIDH